MATTILTECDAGIAVRVHVGDIIEVHLPENAAGGYRWTFEGEDAGPLELTGTGSNYPCGAVGSAGEAVLTVRVRAAGTTRLCLTYGRSWECEGRKHFSVEVHATD